MTVPITLAFFGSSLVSTYWNGAATYYRGIIRALYQRGHRVTFYEPDVLDRQQHRDMDDPFWAKVVVYPVQGTAGASRALEGARGMDVIVKASGVGVLDEWLEGSVLELKGPGTFVCFWDVDAPATLDRVTADRADPFRERIPQYDCILTYGGGRPVIQAYKNLGARACVPIYNALDPTTHYPVPPDPRFFSDLAFLGNRLPDREARVDHFFFQVASTLPNKSFLIGGSGWQDKVMPGNTKYCGHVYARDHNAFNCSPLAVLNISRDSMARYGFSPATRVFEAAGASACLITDYWEGIENFFEPEREILVTRDQSELREQLSSLTPDRARSIGQSARKRALAEHTYTHRVSQLETLLHS
jgi:spore maturation protein CgeB